MKDKVSKKGKVKNESKTKRKQKKECKEKVKPNQTKALKWKRSKRESEGGKRESEGGKEKVKGGKEKVKGGKEKVKGGKEKVSSEMQIEQREKRNEAVSNKEMTQMSGWGEKASGTKQQFEILASEHFNT